MVAGAVGLATAAVGAFWLYGSKHASKHRKIASSWMLRARAEVMDAIEKMKELNKVEYYKIVDDAVKKYSKNLNSKEVTAITKEMQAAWSHISNATKPAKKVVKKAVKKAVKKVS